MRNGFAFLILQGQTKTIFKLIPNIEEFEDEAANFINNVLDYDANTIDEIKEEYKNLKYRRDKNSQACIKFLLILLNNFSNMNQKTEIKEIN